MWRYLLLSKINTCVQTARLKAKLQWFKTEKLNVKNDKNYFKILQNVFYSTNSKTYFMWPLMGAVEKCNGTAWVGEKRMLRRAGVSNLMLVWIKGGGKMLNLPQRNLHVLFKLSIALWQKLCVYITMWNFQVKQVCAVPLDSDLKKSGELVPCP